MKKKYEEEHVAPASCQSSDNTPLELMQVGAVEKVLRKVRAFTCLVIGNRVEADEIVEDALILYLSTDPDPHEADDSGAYLIQAVRRLLRTTGARARRGTDLDQALAPLLDLPLEIREIAALHLGIGLPVAESAALLEISPEEAVAALNTVREAIGPETFDRAAPAA